MSKGVREGVSGGVSKGVSECVCSLFCFWVQQNESTGHTLTRVRHLSNLVHGSSRLEHRDALLRSNAANDDGLLQRAVTALAQRQHNAEEERAGLEQGLHEGAVQVVVELAVLCNVITDSWEKHKVVEPDNVQLDS